MATTKPRITVTLSPRQHEVLKVISGCGGQPMSTLISEMLDMSLPTLERMATAFQKIKAAQNLQRKKLADDLDQAQSAMEPIVQSAIGQFDMFMTKMEEAIGAADEPGAQCAAGASDAPEAVAAPATNRGATRKKGRAENASGSVTCETFKPEKISKKRSMRAS